MKICGTVLRPLARCDHLCSQFPVARHVDLGEVDALLLQKRLGIDAIGAIRRGVDFDGGMGVFDGLLRGFDSQFIWGRAPRRQPGRTPARRHCGRPPAAAPARRRRTVAPEVSTSSTRTRRRPATSALRSAGTRNAPCTLRRARPATARPAARRLDALERRVGDGDAAAPMTLASSADWLKRRAHSRRQCSGTGTSASASASSSRPARAIQRPMVGREVEPVAIFAAHAPACARSRRSAPRRGPGA